MSSRHEDLAANDGFDQPYGLQRFATLPPGFPEAWRSMDFHASVGLILTDYNCVDGQFFRDYAVTSLEAAMANIASDRGNCVFYQFHVPGVVPAFSWDVQWPLLRRGKAPPEERDKVQGPEPWHWHADPTFFEIGRAPLTYWTGRLYLRVGGRNPVEAAETWLACAKVMRSIYRRVCPSAGP